MREPGPTQGILYLLRPHLNPPVLRSYRITLVYYEGDFRQGIYREVSTLRFMNGQFAAFALTPGFYALKLENDPPRIFRIAPGKTLFYALDIYDTRLWRKKARLIQLDREEALSELLIHDRLLLHPEQEGGTGP